jgi:hemolysin III
VRHLRRIDHMMIFLLIAASYTPVCLILLKGGWGWSLFGCIWGFAVLGILLKVFWLQAPRWLYTVVYIVMGWLAIVALWPLAKVLSLGGFLWLFAGGLFYTFGAVIYATKKPNPWPKVIGFHEIFHVFVMLGSFSHFWLMYRYIAPFD